MASAEEIRHAYRGVARLLHPDHCADEETRRLADLQMKRLNGMMAVLSDDAQRAKYDASIMCSSIMCSSIMGTPIMGTPIMGASIMRESIMGTPFLPRLRGFLSSRRRRQWAAGSVILLLAVTLALWPRRPVAPKPIATPPLLAKTAPQPKRPAYRTVRPARQPIVSLATPPIPLEQPPPAALSEPPPTPVFNPIPAVIPADVPTAAPTLSGSWLFVASPSVKHSGYPPEYIELRLIEGAGMLHGRYQARYRVTDRAISPNVAFRFDGRTGPGGGTLPWDGPNGAKGEVTLRLLPTGNLEVDWVAHQLGRELALISGTATLVKKIE